MKLPPLATMRKALAAVIGGLAELIALNVFHGQAQGYAVAIVAGATVVGVYQVPNGAP